MRYRIAYLFAGLLAAQGVAAGQLYGSTVMQDRDAMLLGHRVQAVREAIQNPGSPRALEAIVDLGHDQRYYVMVRGWLAYQLQGDMSIAEASRGQVPEHISTRIRFLKRAIRAIDLE
jgi:hypothetical protein